MVGFFQLFMVWYLARKSNYPTKDIAFTLAEGWRQFKRSGAVALMPILIVGSVFLRLQRRPKLPVWRCSTVLSLACS